MPGSSAAKARANAHLRRRYAECAVGGICTKCGTASPEEGLKVCGSCADKRRAADRARRAGARGKPYAGRDPVKSRRAGRAAAGRGATPGCAQSAAATRPATAGRSARPAGKRCAPASAGATPRASPPASACAARSRRPAACRAVPSPRRLTSARGASQAIFSPARQHGLDHLSPTDSAAASWTTPMSTNSLAHRRRRHSLLVRRDLGARKEEV